MDLWEMPRTAAAARAAGIKFYFTGNPCLKGHVAERYASQPHQCCECHRGRYATPGFLAKNRAHQKAWYGKDAARRMFNTAKERAKLKGVPFDLDIEDITVPEVCPALGIPLEPNVGGRGFKSGSPSLDKIRPELGYVRGNVRVISMLANRIKSDCTDPAVFRKVADYIEWEQLISPFPP